MSRLILTDIGLLLMRVGFGALMFFGHGLGKLNSFLAYGLDAPFGDPLGIGTRLSFLSATTAETLLAILIIIGFQTRLAALGLAFTMGVAAFLAHANDSFFPVFLQNLSPEHPVAIAPFKEYPLLYGLAFLTLFFCGAGRLSVDGRLRGKWM